MAKAKGKSGAKRPKAVKKTAATKTTAKKTASKKGGAKKGGAKKRGAKKASKPPAARVARTSWLDASGTHPLIEQYARHLDSFISTMADGRVDEGEIKAQEARLVALMKEVEPKLNDTLHEQVTKLLGELWAYDAMQALYNFQQATERRPQLSL
jgi:hypothetical protein